MLPLIIDSTKVVIANPARPNGAGFAGDHPALGALGVGALGVTEPSKVPSSVPAVRPAGRAAPCCLQSSPRVPSAVGFAQLDVVKPARCVHSHATSIVRWRQSAINGGSGAMNG